MMVITTNSSTKVKAAASFGAFRHRSLDHAGILAQSAEKVISPDGGNGGDAPPIKPHSGNKVPMPAGKGETDAAC